MKRRVNCASPSDAEAAISIRPRRMCYISSSCFTWEPVPFEEPCITVIRTLRRPRCHLDETLMAREQDRTRWRRTTVNPVIADRHRAPQFPTSICSWVSLCFVCEYVRDVLEVVIGLPRGWFEGDEKISRDYSIGYISFDSICLDLNLGSMFPLLIFILRLCV